MQSVCGHCRAVWLLILIIGLLVLPACRPALKVSEQAAPLPLLDRDPLEDAATPGRWPQWRGRNGSGVASTGSPAIRFGDADGYRWKSRVPGKGNSSPVVWDGRVFLTTEIDTTDPPTLALLCFDLADGRQLWQADVTTPRGRTHAKNGHASASVATDGEHVFAFFGGAGLFCYDFSGQRVWQVDLGPLDHVWGLASSPVLFGSNVIQLCDYDGESYVAAFDKATGSEVWRTPRTSRGCWSTPAFVETKVDGRPRTEMIVNGGSGDDSRKVIAYDPSDGHELWRTGTTTELVTPTPLVSCGLVYSISGRNGPIMAIRPGGDGDVTATHVVWNLGSGGPYIPSGICYRNRLYVLFDSGNLTCFDAGNGRQIWQTRLAGPFTASLIAADGRIYAVSERGRVYVVAAGDACEVLAQNEMRSTCLATPAVADGDLLIRTEADLYCIPGKKAAKNEKPTLIETHAPQANRESQPANPTVNATASADTSPSGWPLFRGDALATGVAHDNLPEQLELLWTFTDPKGGFESTAVIADGTVYLGSVDGKFYALSLADGTKRWELPTTSGFVASAAVRNGCVYVGDSDGRFRCIDASTGKEKWFFDADAEITSGANFHGDRVLFGSQDMCLYCLNADSGTLVWKYESPDQIRCFPTVFENLGFVAGCDGRLHIIDLTEGKETGHVEILAPTGCSPAILDGTVFVGTEGSQFFAIDPRQAKVLWEHKNAGSGGSFRSSAAVTPQAVIVGSRDKQVHAFDPKSGKPLWSFPTKGRVDSSPVVVGSRVFVGSADGRLYAIDLTSGEERWRFEAGGAVVAAPAVAQGRLVIGNDSGSLYCLGAKAEPTTAVK